MQKNAIFTGKQNSPKQEDAHYPFPGNNTIGIPEKRYKASNQTKLKISGEPLVISNKSRNFAEVFRAQR